MGHITEDHNVIADLAVAIVLPLSSGLYSVVGAPTPELSSRGALVDLEALDAICKRMKTFDEAREVDNEPKQ